MRSGDYGRLSARVGDVCELLSGIAANSLRAKPNSYEPTIAESLALALLELDRIASHAPVRPGALPLFASDFLNRRLSRRLLERYPGTELMTEFERRLHDLMRRFDVGAAGEENGFAVERLSRLLAELESVLLQADGQAER